MKNALSLLISIALAWVIVSCGTVQPEKLATTHQRIEAACVSAGTAYGVIIVANNAHPLSAKQQAEVLAAKAIVDKRCLLDAHGDYPYNLQEVLIVELEAACGTLVAAKGAIR